MYNIQFSKDEIKIILQTIKNDNNIKEYVPDIYYILSGGSSKGFAHLGVIKILSEIGIEPSGIVGTSAGSLIGSIYSFYKNVDTALEHFLKIKNSKIYEEFANKYFLDSESDEKRHRLNLWVKKGLSLTKALFAKKMVSEQDMWKLYSLIFENINFSSLKIPFAACATNILTGRAELLSKGDLVKSIMASTAITVIFPIIKIEENYYTDGGISSNFPVREAKLFFNNKNGFYVGSIVSSPLNQKDIHHITSNIFSLLLRVIDISLKNKQFYDSKLSDFNFIPINEDYAWFDFEDYAQFIQLGIKEGSEKLKLFFIKYLEKIKSNINEEKQILKKIKCKNRFNKILKHYQIDLKKMKKL